MLQTLTETLTADKPIKKTKDYSRFKSISGNRALDLKHVERLKQSIEANDLFSPILVNEGFEIIDGQHRFEALRQLGKPVKYMIVDGYGIKEVQLLNTHSKNWTVDDFTECYIAQGIKDYRIYKEFKQAYKFNHNVLLGVLGNGAPDSGRATTQFKDGNFRVADIDAAASIFEKVNICGKYYTGFRRRSFIAALISCLSNKKFSFEEFEEKLKYQSAKLVDCTTVKQYISLIEEIYNFKRREKISLRF